MTVTKQLTLYTATVCPYAQRVELALEEAQLDYTRFEIDLQNKPEWYAPRVNPASKVPAIAYGGPVVDPSQPSTESEKIAESLVLLEFVADVSGKLLPADPILRAKARFFINAVTTILIPGFEATILRGEPTEKILAALEKIQTFLPSEGFVIGPDFTIADAAIAPFLARVEVVLKHDVGKFDAGTGPKAYDALVSDSKFARYRKYFDSIKARDSFKKTWDEGAVRARFGGNGQPRRRGDKCIWISER